MPGDVPWFHACGGMKFTLRSVGEYIHDTPGDHPIGKTHHRSQRSNVECAACGVAIRCNCHTQVAGDVVARQMDRLHWRHAGRGQGDQRIAVGVGGPQRLALPPQTIGKPVQSWRAAAQELACCVEQHHGMASTGSNGQLSVATKSVADCPGCVRCEGCRPLRLQCVDDSTLCWIENIQSILVAHAQHQLARRVLRDIAHPPLDTHGAGVEVGHASTIRRDVPQGLIHRQPHGLVRQHRQRRRSLNGAHALVKPERRGQCGQRRREKCHRPFLHVFFLPSTAQDSGHGDDTRAGFSVPGPSWRPRPPRPTAAP